MNQVELASCGLKEEARIGIMSRVKVFLGMFKTKWKGKLNGS